MTLNSDWLHDDSWSHWHRFFGRLVLTTDIDEMICSAGLNEEVKMEYLHREDNGDEVDFYAIIDHKCGSGSSTKSLKWSAMKAQLSLAKKLNIPMFMSIDFLLPEYPIPCSYMVGCNPLGKQWIQRYTQMPGLWLPPYHYCWFLHKLRGVSMDPNELIDPNNKHIQVPELHKLITKYKLTRLGDLPRKLVKYPTPVVEF